MTIHSGLQPKLSRKLAALAMFGLGVIATLSCSQSTAAIPVHVVRFAGTVQLSDILGGYFAFDCFGPRINGEEALAPVNGLRSFTYHYNALSCNRDAFTGQTAITIQGDLLDSGYVRLTVTTRALGRPIGSCGENPFDCGVGPNQWYTAITNNVFAPNTATGLWKFGYMSDRASIQATTVEVKLTVVHTVE